MSRFIPSRGVVACLRHIHKHTSCLIQNPVQSAIAGPCTMSEATNGQFTSLVTDVSRWIRSTLKLT